MLDNQTGKGGWDVTGEELTLLEQPIIEEIAPVAEPKIAIAEAGNEYGRFVIEPLERGFGVTLGNALRRTLLSSLTGAAITWVRIDGVQHEYSTIPMVKEDVSEILLNMKAIRIKPLSDRPGTLRLEVQGPGQVTAGDIQPSADFEIINAEQYLASLDSDKGSLSMEFNVELGKGYVPATHADDMPIGVMPVDAVFTPVHRVNYNVEKTRVGQITDYERLVLELWSDGSKSSEEAVREAAQILVESFFQFATLGQVVEATPERKPLANAIPADQYNLAIERLDLSARTLNCLKRAKVNKVGEALEKSRAELLKIKNFGERSLKELYDRLQALGLLQLSAEGNEGNANSEDAPTANPALQADDNTDAKTSQETIRDLAALRAALLGGDAAATPKTEEAPDIVYSGDLTSEDSSDPFPEPANDDLGDELDEQ